MAELAISTPPPDPPEGVPKDAYGNSVKGLKKANMKAIENRERLKAYLAPKLSYVDAGALLAASNRGKRDLEIQRGVSVKCTYACRGKPNSCYRSCMLKDPVTKRIWGCESLDFLPH
jgi:hypothetical protein